MDATDTKRKDCCLGSVRLTPSLSMSSSTFGKIFLQCFLLYKIFLKTQMPKHECNLVASKHCHTYSYQVCQEKKTRNERQIIFLHVRHDADSSPYLISLSLSHDADLIHSKGKITVHLVYNLWYVSLRAFQVATHVRRTKKLQSDRDIKQEESETSTEAGMCSGLHIRVLLLLFGWRMFYSLGELIWLLLIIPRGRDTVSHCFGTPSRFTWCPDAGLNAERRLLESHLASRYHGCFNLFIYLFLEITLWTQI